MAAKTLVIGKSGIPATLDPTKAQSGNELTIVQLAYETLLKPSFNAEIGFGTSITSSIAKEWFCDKAETSWTFVLDNRTFSDGAKVDSSAVKKSLLAMQDSPGYASTRLGCIKHVECISEHVLRVDLSRRSATFLNELTAPYASIVSPSVGELRNERDNILVRRTFGSGPYQVSTFDDESIVMEPNGNYSCALQDSAIVFKFIADSVVRKNMLKGRQIHIAENLSLEHIDELRSCDDVRIEDGRSTLVTYVVLNCSSGIFANLAARKAFLQCLDFHALRSIFGAGNSTPLASFVPLGVNGSLGKEGVFQFPTNGEVQSLIDEAGLRGKTIRFLVDYPGDQSYWSDAARVVRSRLEQFGVNVLLDRVEFTEMRRKIDVGDFDVTVVDWNLDYLDGGATLNYWLHSRRCGLGGNMAFYKNRDIDMQLDAADAESNEFQRLNLLREIQQSAMNDVPYIPMVQRHFHFAALVEEAEICRTDPAGWQAINVDAVLRYMQKQT